MELAPKEKARIRKVRKIRKITLEERGLPCTLKSTVVTDLKGLTKVMGLEGKRLSRVG